MLPSEAPLLFWLWDRNGPHLGHVNYTLRLALDTAGYTEASYYTVPDGFALVTHLEQINPDGTPKKPDHVRWSTQLARVGQFTLSAYLKALFLANPGYYRVIVFVVTSQPFSQSEATVTRDEAIAWLRHGGNALPFGIATQPLLASHKVTALIYEFEKSDIDELEAKFTIPGRLSTNIHLTNSGIRGSLR